LTERSHPEPIRVALVESTHWHMPLYLPALETPGVDLVAVSDSIGRTAPGLRTRFGCRTYPDTETLLANETIDFAFAFGRHADMPRLAEMLISRHIPFGIEKPCGIRSDDVLRLAEAATRAGVYVSVPFIFRQSDLLREIGQRHADQPFQADHASFRFMAGPPARYPAAGNGWMLDPTISGGGPLINLGVHFIDLFGVLVGEPVTAVSAASTSHMHGLPIEDAISVRLQTASGRIGTIECGYTFPSDPVVQREFTFSVRTKDGYFQSHPEGMSSRTKGVNGVWSTAVQPVRLETDFYYPEFVARSLSDATTGAPPLASLADAAKALAVVEAAYRSAAQGGAPQRMAP
jgi:predicted dehydrogenase